MSQVLSQQEIDSLLEAMDSGAIDEQKIEEIAQPKVKLYDFRRPIRLSKEYLSTITMVFEDFAKIAVNHLSTQLRNPVDIKLASIEQVSFDEFVHSVPRFTLMGIFESKPLNGIQIIEINPQVSLQMVDLLCGYGSTDEVYQENTEKDAFTEIELAILEEVMAGYKRSFESAWKDIVEVDVTLESLETNPQLLQAMSPSEPVILVTFSLSIGNTHSYMNVCVPYIFFETILDKLSFTNWFHSGKEMESIDSTKIKKLLEPIPVMVEVELGKSEMTVADFLEMEPGDILQLEKRAHEPLVMKVEGRSYYRVKPGKVNNKLAVEVLQVMEEGNEK